MVERRAIKYGIIKHACEAKRRQLISSIISYGWPVVSLRWVERERQSQAASIGMIVPNKSPRGRAAGGWELAADNGQPTAGGAQVCSCY